MLSCPGARRAVVRYRDVAGPDEGMAGGASRNPVSRDAGVCFCHPHRAHDFRLEFGAVGAVGSVLGESETASKCGGGTKAIYTRGKGRGGEKTGQSTQSVEPSMMYFPFPHGEHICISIGVLMSLKPGGHLRSKNTPLTSSQR